MNAVSCSLRPRVARWCSNLRGTIYFCDVRSCFVKLKTIFAGGNFNGVQNPKLLPFNANYTFFNFFLTKFLLLTEFVKELNHVFFYPLIKICMNTAIAWTSKRRDVV